MSKICDICSNKCWGSPGYHGSCCSIEDRDFIIGPHTDSEEFLTKLNEKFGREFEFDEIFYSYEKGKTIFPNKSTWQNPNSYPALKINFSSMKKPCIFYNTQIKACSIYEIRPKTCQDYMCDYLKENLS